MYSTVALDHAETLGYTRRDGRLTPWCWCCFYQIIHNHSDGDVANVSFTPGWLCCAAIMTSIDTYADRSHHAAESLPSTSSGTFAHTGKTSLPPRSTSGSHSGTLPYSRAASMAISPRGRKGSFMSTAHSYATGAEREQAEAYFSDLLSYR